MQIIYDNFTIKYLSTLFYFLMKKETVSCYLKLKKQLKLRLMSAELYLLS